MIMERIENYTDLACAIENWIEEIMESASAEGLVVGISGGIDSAVAAALGTGAAGRSNVLGLLMPCGNPEENTRDGLEIVRHLGIEHRIIDLEPVLESFLECGGLEDTDRLNRANIKARLRMTMLYAHSSRRLVLGTSNYSEIRVGYWTKWGDGASDLLPIGRLYKDEVVKLAETLNLPEWILKKVPSADLWKGQSDEEEMGVTYAEIKSFFQNGEVSEDSRRVIREMVDSTRHKRDPIVYFDLREWMEKNG
ncbi:MAG: NAD(+) synthase [Candidatus Aegiribacteria sp.]|nr:NAD(+) synthase [Candidatus Aegiribacteria sp.]MBD3295566.1 NAD(+) synthase [Candidatus Fermentibacteria bacterium]